MVSWYRYSKISTEHATQSNSLDPTQYCDNTSAVQLLPNWLFPEIRCGLLMPPNTGQYFTRISFTTHNYTAVPPGISGLINVLSYSQNKNMRYWDSGYDGTQTGDKSCFKGVWTVFVPNLHLLLPSVLNNSSLFHQIKQYILAFYLGVLFKINFIFKAYQFSINYNLNGQIFHSLLNYLPLLALETCRKQMYRRKKPTTSPAPNIL